MPRLIRAPQGFDLTSPPDCAPQLGGVLGGQPGPQYSKGGGGPFFDCPKGFPNWRNQPPLGLSRLWGQKNGALLGRGLGESCATVVLLKVSWAGGIGFCFFLGGGKWARVLFLFFSS